MSSSVSLAAAFLAGLFSFISPCVLPIVPGYLSFISGVNVAQWKAGGAPGDLVRRVALTSLVFVLGFSTVFVALGAAATLVGSLLQEHKRTLGMIGGVVVIVLGLHTAGVFKIRWLLSEKRASVQEKPLGLVGAYVVGLAFAFGWTPCIGPILGAILLYASQQETVTQGVVLLAAYSAGLGIPFLLSALAVNWFFKASSGLRRSMHAVEVVSGVLLVGVGLLLVTDRLTLIASWVSRLLPGLARIG
ncbi:MAG TPA: cytochrome c biogenesis protein CcdA [Vicinamibacteria bacterium]|nr:cytochrome c biogenesis protein CcdA [Vicinamibacteria bacterium]